MAIITISRGSFSGGKNLAERLAARLDYRCLPRVELVEAARRYGISEGRLSRAMSEAPGILERLSSEKADYLACIRATLISEVRDNNVVYHGLAGHFLLEGVPQVLRIRVIANRELRIQAAMDRGAMTREDAIQIINTMDSKRTKWTKFLYHVDWYDPSLYDLVLNLDHLDLTDACDIVEYTLGLEKYKAGPGSRRVMDDLVLSSHIKAILAADRSVESHKIEVEADSGVITLSGTAESMVDADRVRMIVRGIPGVNEVNSMMRVRFPVFALSRA